MKMKTAPKVMLIAGVVIGGYIGITGLMNRGYVSRKATIAVSVPDKIDLPAGGAAAVPTATTSISAQGNGDNIRVKTIPWNGTSGMHYANAGGLFKAHGLNVSIAREDDYAKLIADMAAFAKDNNTGSHFTIIMGDGLPAFITGLNAALKPFNQEGAMIAGIGYSRGEDKCIISDTVQPRGSLIAGYLGDGDINICVKYAADNGRNVRWSR